MCCRLSVITTLLLRLFKTSSVSALVSDTLIQPLHHITHTHLDKLKLVEIKQNTIRHIIVMDWT